MTTNHIKSPWFAWLLPVELAIIVFYITPVLSITSPGFPLDDSWIYAVFARNFISSGEIAFNLGHPSLGFTSSLWFLFLSLGRLLSLPPVVWSIFLGVVSQVTLAVIMGLLVHRFLSSFRRDLTEGSPSGNHSPFPIPHSPESLSLFASLLVLLCGPLIWYSLSGMETTCFMAIGLPAIYLLSRGWYRWAGLALGFLLITRIEGMALWGIALVYAAVVEYRRKTGTVHSALCSMPSAKRLLPIVLIPSIFLLLELLKNLCLTGALLPTTFAGRKWLSVPAGGRGPIAYLKLWGQGFKITLLPQFLQENPFLIIFWIGAGLFAIISIRLLFKVARADRRRISGLVLLFLWIIGHNLVYMVMLPSPSQAGRYQALNFLLFWIVLYLPIAAGLVRLKLTAGGKRKALSAVLLFILLGGIFLLDLTSTFRWKDIYLSTVRHINDVHIQIAHRIESDLPPGRRVAAFDIGALKYFSPGTEIIDLGGLVDREFAGYLLEGRVVDYMADREADYLAMVELQNSPGWIFENLHILDDPRVKLKPLFGMMQRPEIYRLHYRTAAITFPKMVVYEIEWGVGSGE
ncbi:MAG: hypothetical protein U9N73_09815 [Candidatus Auribacterota bacterium]|nr:hypothetical protein [Candidatus Auribacterota bacterium]